MTMPRGRRRAVRAVGLGLSLALLTTGCSAVAAPEAPTSSTASTAPGADRTARGSSGLSTCPLSSLPAQTAEVVADIHSGGPFAFPSNDGVRFGNREGVLPKRPSRYYREYTVTTPGSHTRGARRIVTGGDPAKDPPQYFYTGDHYATFCEITGANR